MTQSGESNSDVLRSLGRRLDLVRCALAPGGDRSGIVQELYAIEARLYEIAAEQERDGATR